MGVPGHPAAENGDLRSDGRGNGAAGLSVRVITEAEFSERIREVLAATDTNAVGFVTGPGRSGAVAAVYASHLLRVPFVPYGATPPIHLGRALIVDTASESGATMRKAGRKYKDADPVLLVAYQEPPRVMFWYEARKPQRYRHEARAAA